MIIVTIIIENSSVYKNNITETTTTAGSIHVALSVDSKQFIAVPNFINSLKKHSNNIVVHILVTGDASKLLSLIECCNINNGVEVCIIGCIHLNYLTNHFYFLTARRATF